MNTSKKNANVLYHYLYISKKYNPKTYEPTEVHNESCSSQNFDEKSLVACDRYLYDPSGKNSTIKIFYSFLKS